MMLAASYLAQLKGTVHASYGQVYRRNADIFVKRTAQPRRAHLTGAVNRPDDEPQACNHGQTDS